MSGDLRYLMYVEDALMQGDVSWLIHLLREGAAMPASTMQMLADMLDPSIKTDASLVVKFRKGPRPDPDRDYKFFRLGEQVSDRASDGVKLESVVSEMEAEGHGSRSTLLDALRYYRVIRAQESDE